MWLDKAVTDSMQSGRGQTMVDSFYSTNARRNFLWYSVNTVFPRYIFINKQAKRLKEGEWLFGTLFTFKKGRDCRLRSFCLEPINMNSSLVIINVNPLLTTSWRSMLNKSLFREDWMDTAIRISQMGIISIHSWLSMRETVADPAEAPPLFLDQTEAQRAENNLSGSATDHWRGISE